MPEPPMILPPNELRTISDKISETIQTGGQIRALLSDHSTQGPFDIAWEVDAAVEALDVFGSRWTIEILSTLYIAGDRRFNEMKHLLKGISSRTLSDKLRYLVEEDLVVRSVSEGPPIRVTYRLSEHGKTCGRLLSPLVAFMKIHKGSIIGA
jgi:DNA-binding HxlR family transcriptional regulator|tara:strand:- start:894 stop:1349 length:456 start_codon:yes stop_codon:yes gene_type:complete